MARLDDALDLFGGVGHLLHGAHGKVNLLHVFRSGEVTAHRIGNQDGLVLNLRIAEVGHGLSEDANDGEGDAENLKGLADRRVGAAEAFLGEEFGDHGTLDVS